MPGNDPAAVWCAQRWVACGLGGPEGGVAAPDVRAEVGRLGAVQAQELDMTIWSLGQRTGESRARIQDALAGPEIVRTHTLRPTWHLVLAEDLPKAQAATADRVRRQMAGYSRQLGLDGPTMARFADVLETSLTEGPRTRAALREDASTAGLDFDGMTLSIALMHAELDVMIGSGPPQGTTQTYRLLGATLHQDREEAVRWLVEAFLKSHGPSSIKDICAWSSLTVADVRRVLSELGSQVTSEEILGEDRHWVGALPEVSWDSPTTELLNVYDEYISGLSPRSKPHLDPDRLYRGRPRTPLAAFMIDGMLAGNWRRTLSSKVIVEVGLLRALDPSEEGALKAAAQRYAAFVGRPLELVATLR